MPLYDWECQKCGFVFEDSAPSEVKSKICSVDSCGGRAIRLMPRSVSHQWKTGQHPCQQ